MRAVWINRVPYVIINYCFCSNVLYRSAERMRKNVPRVDWVNSSKAYKKEEIDIPGAPRVKKITKVGPTDLKLVGVFHDNGKFVNSFVCIVKFTSRIWLNVIKL
jgi:hypothetical protein